MKRSIEKVAIANRGEVAVRIVRACQELGLETVLLHSEVDVGTLAYRISDEQVCIGAAPTSESYLNIEANIQGALSVGADAIHPGFGFLSENAEFAQACEDHRMIFIGPSPKSIRLFGDKISAKNLVLKAKGPVIPGYQGEDQSLKALVKKAKEIGFPVMVKATAGGGGRGLKIIRTEAEAVEAIQSAQREGQSAFGSSQVFLEKYLDHAKHIEFQIFGDASGKVYHLNDRECSVQRRHQKIIEEALSPSLDEDLRRQMAEVSLQIAREANYRGAGTIEFLLQDGQFYFLEMNTRLQVEHPVTEWVMGVDLVKSQIYTAMGQQLYWDQSVQPRGHSIECRIYAEDPYMAGMPSVGELLDCHWPAGPGRRFEVGFEPGDEVTSFYDPMIAKVIVWDESRARAIQKMKATLRETRIFGLKTNIPYLQAILSHQEFTSGTMHTGFISQYFPQGLEPESLSTEEEELIRQLRNVVGSGRHLQLEANLSPWYHVWSQG